MKILMKLDNKLKRSAQISNEDIELSRLINPSTLRINERQIIQIEAKRKGFGFPTFKLDLGKLSQLSSRLSKTRILIVNIHQNSLFSVPISTICHSHSHGEIIRNYKRSGTKNQIRVSESGVAETMSERIQTNVVVLRLLNREAVISCVSTRMCRVCDW